MSLLGADVQILFGLFYYHLYPTQAPKIHGEAESTKKKNPWSTSLLAGPKWIMRLAAINDG
jgi:hypothetical protein